MSFVVSGEIRAREVMDDGRSARYINIDRGVIGKDGRGEISSSCNRLLENGKREHVTFLAGTINNISMLLNKGLEVSRYENGRWVAISKTEFEKFAFEPSLEMPGELPPQVIQEEGESENENKGEQVTITSVEDFLAQPAKIQLINLPAAPDDFLVEIINHEKTTKKVRSVAGEVLESRKAEGINAETTAE